MSIAEETTLRVILDDRMSPTPLASERRFEIIQALLSQGYYVAGVDALDRLDASFPIVTVAHETDPSPSPNAEVHRATVSDWSESNVLEAVEATRVEVGAVKSGSWKPWFPVIDYDRCTNCMQCLSFCLFGVYGVTEEQQIQVQNNDNCKTNCPACSRVCPEAAIMFPKYKAGPINGEAVSSEDLEREKMKVDISSLLGGDVYSMLRQRSERAKTRFSKERDSDKALNERIKCLKKLQEDAADIPPEVLASLPSKEEIAQRADEASRKAEAALEASRSRSSDES